jgi:hypothetical protein
MISVPLLALAGSWQMAALLIVVERIGRATRDSRVRALPFALVTRSPGHGRLSTRRAQLKRGARRRLNMKRILIFTAALAIAAALAGEPLQVSSTARPHPCPG